MNWTEAVEAMLAGHTVRRQSEMWVRTDNPGRPELQGKHWRDGIEHAPELESGEEGCRLMGAWTVDDKPVMIFMGADSGCVYMPEDKDRNATDWVIEGAI